ncbi:hypothetical protein HDE69_002222 [Pedobacter cryoconitis]|uniref:Uncharacterized protein n=1 Tax=Pedobacter cryoconitis TaxID=188932 RepID=A0A7W8YSV9_9SPHI|nr:hypothetical protein [Pedobacter cryoconitis]MBB5621169.1 hypothetical protein [Pedobacter cryoconitis]MBB5645519.1 hypothetical protein [Pedobacter cryoconitis]
MKLITILRQMRKCVVIALLLYISCGVSAQVKKQAVYLGFELMNPEFGSYFPLQLFNLKGVKNMKINSNENELFKDLRIEFNSKGQLIKAVGKKDSLVITYRDNAPIKFTTKNQALEFRYSGDTVIVMDHQIIALYNLRGSVFLNTKIYALEEGNQTKTSLVLKSSRIVEFKGDSLQLIADQNNKPRYITSSKNQILPFTRTYNMGDQEQSYLVQDAYANDSQGNLIVDKTLSLEDRLRFLFTMKNGRPVSISTTRHFLSEDGQTVRKSTLSPGVPVISYEYFN